MADRAERGEDGRMMESGGEPEENATLFSSSVARRLEWELARELRLALEVVMDGSVAEARRSLGRLLLLELRMEESRRDMDRESGGEAMSEVCCDKTVVFVVLEGKVFVDVGRVCWLGLELVW
jgi:hypothetical protein